jgi:hypothetical protein
MAVLHGATYAGMKFYRIFLRMGGPARDPTDDIFHAME